MSTPWDNAPEWARWRATDETGWTYWYEYEPIMGQDGWYILRGQSKLDSRPEWQASKEGRPADDHSKVSWTP
jgi:hypothetical protein